MIGCLCRLKWYILEIQQQVDGGAYEREFGGLSGLHEAEARLVVRRMHVKVLEIMISDVLNG